MPSCPVCRGPRDAADLAVKGFNPFKSGKVVLFETSFDKDTAFLELVGFVALGALTPDRPC